MKKINKFFASKKQEVFKMKKTFFVVLLTAIVLSFSVFALDLNVNPNPVPISGSHGSSAQGTITISNSNLIENFTSVTLHSLNSSLTFTTTAFQLNAGQNRQIQFSVAIPRFALGDYSYLFTVNGTKSNGENESINSQVNLNVVSSPSLTLSQPATLSRAANTTGITVTNTGNSVLNNLNINYTTTDLKDDSGEIKLTFNPSSILSLSPNQAVTLNVTALIPDGLNSRDFSSTIKVFNELVNVTTTLIVSQTFCEFGDIGSGLEIRSLNDEQLDNEDEWEWRLQDNIEITVKVKNNANEDLDAILEYRLFDTVDNNFIDIDEKDIDFSINEDDTEEVTIKFQVPASELDFDSASRDFKFFVKVYEDGEEDTRCKSDFENVKIKKESRDVVLDNIDASSTALCGEDLELTAKVVNVGRNDEDRARVLLYNKELGLDLAKEIKNLDVGDSARLSFNFKVPQNIAAKSYVLNLKTEFDYDDNEEAYDEESKVFTRTLSVEGGSCQVSGTNLAVAITPSLETAEEDVAAGKEVTIKARVNNIGDKTATFTIGLEGNGDFSATKSITPQTLTLDAGKSGDVTIILKLDDDAEGEQEFSITASSDGKVIKSQSASLIIAEIQPGGGAFLGGVIGSLGKNSFIWVIVGINVLLIVIIIIVAVKMSR